MKKNIKFMIGIVVGIVIGAASGIGVYATLTYSAGDIAYTKSGNSTPISVSSALNELYQNKKDTTDDTKNVTTNGNITLDKYYKNLNVNVPIPLGYVQPSGTKTITTKANNIDVSNYQYANTTGMYTADEYNAKTGEGEYWKKDSVTFPSNSNTFVYNKINFKPSQVIMNMTIDNVKEHFFSWGNYFYRCNGSGTHFFVDISDRLTLNNTGFIFTYADRWKGTNVELYLIK